MAPASTTKSRRCVGKMFKCMNRHCLQSLLAGLQFFPLRQPDHRHAPSKDEVHGPSSSSRSVDHELPLTICKGRNGKDRWFLTMRGDKRPTLRCWLAGATVATTFWGPVRGLTPLVQDIEMWSSQLSAPNKVAAICVHETTAELPVFGPSTCPDLAPRCPKLGRSRSQESGNWVLVARPLVLIS